MVKRILTETQLAVRSWCGLGSDECGHDPECDVHALLFAANSIRHLVRYEYRLKDHRPALIVNTIDQVLDQLDKDLAHD